MSHPCLIPTEYHEKNSPQKCKEQKKISEPFDAIDIKSMDANDYLARVIKQAKEMPDIFVADLTSKNGSRQPPAASSGHQLLTSQHQVATSS